MTILKREFLLFLLIVGVLMTGCKTMNSCGVPGGSPYRDPESLQQGEILHVPTGVTVSEHEFYDLTAGSRIVYVGESHDNIYAHQLELDIAKSLYRRYPGQLAVGMEMFGRQSQEDIDRWLAGKMDDREFLSVFGRDWGVLDYPYYRDLLNFIRDQQIPLRAINVSRSEKMSLLQQRRELHGDEYPQPDDSYQKQALAAMFAGHAGGHEHLAMFYGMQMLWEETMVESIIDYLDSEAGRNKKMLVFTGGFHVAYGFGLPRKVFKQRKWPYSIILPSTPAALEENKPQRMDVDFPELPLYMADYLWCIPYRNLNDSRVRLGVQLQDVESGVKIMLVQPGSAAEVAGVEPEDVIKAIDGQPVQKSHDVQSAILGKKIGDSSRLILVRSGRELEVTVQFVAPMNDEAEASDKK
jgi:uncharacterized iron-regulated protein